MYTIKYEFYRRDPLTRVFYIVDDLTVSENIWGTDCAGDSWVNNGLDAMLDDVMGPDSDGVAVVASLTCEGVLVDSEMWMR